METSPRVLGNRYELISVLATGGMGQVWRAADTLLGRPVAVKLLRSEFASDPHFLSRFRSEAQHAALLSHPNIAAVFDYGELDVEGEHLAYLVMELVEGESLDVLLAREGRLSPECTLSILRQCASALAAAHEAGMVHRDVKPGNVLVSPSGAVKIADFGIAWSASSVPLTRTGQVVGTAFYLSPEQAAGGKATPASDVYALGVLAYECLAGRRPFDGEGSVQVALQHLNVEPPPLPVDVPADLRALVAVAMEKDPALRFVDGAALLRAVDVLSGAPAAVGVTVPLSVPVRARTAVMSAPSAPASGGPVLPLVPPWSRLPRGLLLWALLGLLGILLLVVLFSSSNDSAPEAPASEAPPTVPVLAEEYLGRDVAEVQADLVGKGLDPVLVPVESAAVPPGQVTGLDPVGELSPGSSVSVSYAVPPAVVPAPEDRGEEKEKGEGKGEEKGEEKGGGKKDD